MKKTIVWVSIVIFIALAVTFGFTDFAISENFANPQSSWAHFMEAYGQLPGMLIGFFGGSILLRLTKKEKSFKSILLIIGGALLTLFMAFGFWGDLLGQQIDAEVNYLLVILLSIVLLIAVQLIFLRIPVEKMKKFKSFAVIAVLLFFLAGFVTVWGIKIPWGRWTYRDMSDAGDFSLFTPWYLPQGINGHHSFISGHTAIAFCVLPIVLLFRANKKWYTIAWVLALAWGIVSAVSRVAIGAHFASDVLFGGGETLLWFMLLKKHFLKDKILS